MKQNLQHSGIGAVGVQLYGIAKITDFFKKLRQLRLERRLPAGDANTVQFAPAPLQICKHLRLRDFRPPAPLRKHQVGVMAVWAAQIAAETAERQNHAAGTEVIERLLLDGVECRRCQQAVIEWADDAALVLARAAEPRLPLREVAAVRADAAHRL